MLRNIRLDRLKIRTKNYLQTSTATLAQSKLNSQLSFQKLLSNNPDFDDYINSIHARMAQEQTDHPILVIPQKFKDFIHSKLFKELLKRIYEYMLLLEQYEHKFKTVLLDHGIKPDHLMLTETAALEQKCKEISFVYMGILLSYGESKNIFRDQYFFETMIYFLGQILKENFEEEVYPTIDLELNRMFRTNTFNLIKRRYEEDAVIKEYPELKDNKYVCSPQGDQRVIKRLRVHKKFRYAAEISPRTAVSLPKPMNIPQSALKAIHSRSPLVASFYPSEREKVFNFVREHQGEQIVRAMRSTRSYSFSK